MSLIHSLSSLGCIAGALAMMALARDYVARWAHVVMVAAMTALFATMDARLVVLASALVLGVTAVALLYCRHRERRTCAVDTLSCAAVLGLLGAGSAGGHMTMATISSGLDARLVVGVLAVGLVWVAVTCRTSPRRGVASWGAATVMFASMGAMTLG